jgi:hypothetical protein
MNHPGEYRYGGNLNARVGDAHHDVHLSNTDYCCLDCDERTAGLCFQGGSAHRALDAWSGDGNGWY